MSVDTLARNPARRTQAAADRHWRRVNAHPDASMVAAAAAMFEPRDHDDRMPVAFHKGRQTMLADRRVHLTVGPGLFALRVFDPVKAEIAANPYLSPAPLHVDKRMLPVDLRDLLDCEGRRLSLGWYSQQYRQERDALLEALDPDALAAYRRGGPRRAIVEWSRKSRTRMVRAIGELDLAAFTATGTPAMLTVTYPGDWLTVAPSGEVVKAHLQKLQDRYEAAWGAKLCALWKLEFQRRGAPHVHMLMIPPADWRSFREWVRYEWADIVDHPDPDERVNHMSAGASLDFAEGLRCKDPRRCAVYFLKHSSKTSDDKEYQHIVPEAWRLPGCGPGRFWGHWGIAKASVVVDIEIPDFYALRRTVRRWDQAQAARCRCGEHGRPLPAHVRAGRCPNARPPRVYRSSRMVGGFAVVNSGPNFAANLARWLDMRKAGLALTARQARLARLLLDRDRSLSRTVDGPADIAD